ncbi:MAG: aromatic amino acid transport family protein [Chlamydiota bacterium]|nr:aromatic amino acid transport family protein [Chlamydiota bacterium]
MIKTLNAALLITGTSVGAAMLGLPLQSGQMGFYPSFILFVLMAMVTGGTALLLTATLEKSPQPEHFLSLTQRLLPRPFFPITLVVYLLLFLSLTFAYTKSGGEFIFELFPSLSHQGSLLLFLCLFVPPLFFNRSFLGQVNSCFTVALFLPFIMLLIGTLPSFNQRLLSTSNWEYALPALPILLTSFGFHNVVPSLYRYLGGGAPLRRAIYIGVSLTLVIYLLWQWAVMGNVPLDSRSEKSESVIPLLIHHLEVPTIRYSARLFGFFALVTSFFGVGLGLIDFLLDTLKLPTRLKYRLLMALLIYLPAFILANSSLKLFTLAIQYGAGPSCFYILLLLPLLFFFNRSKQ